MEYDLLEFYYSPMENNKSVATQFSEWRNLMKKEDPTFKYKIVHMCASSTVLDEGPTDSLFIMIQIL